MENDQSQPVKKTEQYAVPHDLLQAIADKLVTLPFSQVFQLLDTVGKLTPIPGTETEKIVPIGKPTKKSRKK